MRHQKLFCGAILLLAALPIMAQTSTQQSVVGDKHKHHHYKLIDLGTFGGPQSYVYLPYNYAPVLNNRGTVAGWADTSKHDPYPKFCFNKDCFVSDTFQAQNGALTNLGALKQGVSSASSWISPNGLIAGLSENGKTDPLVPGFPEFRAVLWEDGNIRDLGTLPEGGYESLANAVNSGGLVVGMATNKSPDSHSIFGLGYETRAFRWDNQNGMEDLGTLGGTDAEALLVNEQGQIVGVSYTNSSASAYCAQSFGLFLTTGAFLWQKGKMTDLGNFGGTCTFPADLNERGQVVGISTLKGDRFQHAFLWNDGSLIALPNALGGHNGAAIALNNTADVTGWATLPGDQVIHASLWKNSIMTDLGTADGDQCSYGYSINARRQVVGVSVPACNFSLQRAFLWEHDSIADLNTLIPPASPLYLTVPETINDRGEIAGYGFDSGNNQHAFLLLPCDKNHGGVEGCDYSLADSVAAIPESTVPAMHGPTNTAPRNARGGSTLRRQRQIHPLSNPVSDDSSSFSNWEQQLVPEGHAMQEFDALRGGRCARRGMQCPPWIKCCPGLICVPGSTRAFCE
jgi:probable HAF family extracellular repeat protein